MCSASEQLRECEPFRKVLQAVLALGNHLNEVRCDLVAWGQRGRC